MIRTVRFLRRQPRLTAREFRWQILTSVGCQWEQAARHLPVRAVTLAFPRDEQVTAYREDRGERPLPMDFDAVEEATFATMDDLQQVVQSGFLEALSMVESELVAGAADPWREITHGVVVADRADADFSRPVRLKTVLTLARKRDLDRHAFRDYWLNHHRPYEQEAVHIGSLHRIEVGFALGQQVARQADGQFGLRPGAPAFDALMDMYSVVGTDLVAGYERPLPPEVLVDERRFLDRTVAGRRAIMEEYRLVP